MNDSKRFLARWSRRKREAVKDSTQTPPPALDDDEGSEASVSVPPTALAGSAEPPVPFDPASLPSLDSIGANSDIRAFLATGVPAELRQAALRRAWSSDPAIRDFIGLSENAWDFNAQDIPGFGGIEPAQVASLVRHFARSEPESAPTEAKPGQEGPVTMSLSGEKRPEISATERTLDSVCSCEQGKLGGVDELNKIAAVPPPQEAGAAQKESTDPTPDRDFEPRRHGRALPG